MRYCCGVRTVVQDEAECTRASLYNYYVRGRCVRLFINSRLTWYEARQNCLETGGDLLRVDDDNVLSDLANWLQLHQRWWIDGVNEIWNWDNGNTVTS